jgi:hypothetical protein
MPRGRHFFGRGFWKAGYYGYPFPVGGGRGRGRGFYRAAIPYMTGNWASPYVPNYPPAQPSFYRGGYYPPTYAGHGGISFQRF